MTTPIVTSSLFTDLVDSTAMAARLGPEAAEELRRTHFGLLRDAISTTGGTEVKNLGDGLMVVFASPSRALACAVEIQQAVGRHNARAREPLAIRIGISVGEALEAEGDYFGESVVEAARLCAVAHGGQVLATAMVRAMAGRHSGQVFGELGLMTLKGLPEPVEVVEVRWEPSRGDSAVPMPAALLTATRDVRFGFVGRSSELAEIESVCKQAFTEPRLHTVMIGGEAGIGKTTLTARLCNDVHAAGTTVLLGHCDEDMAVPYLPWIEAISHLIRHVGDDCVASLSPLHRDALARLIPALGGHDTVRAAAAESDRLVLMNAVEGLLAAASAMAPVVVVLDDLHWADAASLHLVRHLVARVDPMAVVLLGTYRTSDIDADHPLTALLADLHRQSAVARLRLGGLDDSAMVDLVTAAAGHSLDPGAVDLAQSLHRETDGNPFFTGELLRHIGETGAVQQDADGRWVLQDGSGPLALPASVRDVVLRRVTRLGSESLKSLSLASVIGRDFSIDVLAAISDRSEDDLLDLLDQAAVAEVIGERPDAPGTYRFTHALIQRTLYEDLSATRRARCHQRIAELLESAPVLKGARTAELARHWVAAVRPAELDRALHYVILAADEALAALAPDDAIRWYSQALELMGRGSAADPATRCRLLIGLGTAQRQVGNDEHRASLLEAISLARGLGNSDLLVAALLSTDRGVAGTSGADLPWIEATEAALAAIGPDDSRARARLLGVLSQSIAADEWERRRELINEAVAVARRLDDHASLLVLLPIAYQCHYPEEIDRRLADTAEAVELSHRYRDQRALCNALFHRFDACMQVADLAGADHSLEELGTLARSMGLPFHLWQYHMLQACRDLLAGRTAEAERGANEAVSVGTAGGHGEAAMAFGLQFMEVMRHHGRLAEVLEPMAALSPTEITETAGVGFRSIVAAFLSEAGWLDQAAAILALGSEAAFEGIPRDEAWILIMCATAAVAVDVAEPAAAEILYRSLSPFERRVATAYHVGIGAVARYLGTLQRVLGDYDTAETHLRVADDIHARLDAPYWTACTLLDWRDLYRARSADGDEQRATDCLDRALQLAESYEFAGIVARANRAHRYGS